VSPTLRQSDAVASLGDNGLSNEQSQSSTSTAASTGSQSLGIDVSMETLDGVRDRLFSESLNMLEALRRLADSGALTFVVLRGLALEPSNKLVSWLVLVCRVSGAIGRAYVALLAQTIVCSSGGSPTESRGSDLVVVFFFPVLQRLMRMFSR